MSVRVGLTLPSFVEDPEIPIAVARAAEAAGLDAVFVFDHLWRGDPPNRRPALECFALLGAVAAETDAHPGRHARRARDAAPAGDARQLLPDRAARERRSADRRRSARATRRAGPRTRRSGSSSARWSTASPRCTTRCAPRAGGDYPVWVGGRAAQVREIVAIADGWNGWGGTPERFAADAELVREVAPDATLTWGGLVLTGDDDAAARGEGRARVRSPTTCSSAARHASPSSSASSSRAAPSG